MILIDHLCRNRKCVNPEHLEAVTQQENIRRIMPTLIDLFSWNLEAVTQQENIRRGLGGKINNHQVKKTHCSKGHEYAKENTRIYKNERICRSCRSAIDKEYHEQHKKILNARSRNYHREHRNELNATLRERRKLKRGMDSN